MIKDIRSFSYGDIVVKTKNDKLCKACFFSNVGKCDVYTNVSALLCGGANRRAVCQRSENINHGNSGVFTGLSYRNPMVLTTKDID